MACNSKKKASNLTPPEIITLRKNPKFVAYNEEELFEYYYQFKELTQSNDRLDQRQFYQLIQAFNVSSLASFY